MQDGRSGEPEQDADGVPVQQPYARVAGEAERGDEQDQVERALAVQAARREARAAGPGGAGRYGPGGHHSSPNVRVSTHLVFRTPGAAGTMIRAG
ncbi:hypothetical protein GCM10027028_46260 [Streptomyces sundarbansensis]